MISLCFLIINHHNYHLHFNLFIEGGRDYSNFPHYYIQVNYRTFLHVTKKYTLTKNNTPFEINVGNASTPILGTSSDPYIINMIQHSKLNVLNNIVPFNVLVLKHIEIIKKTEPMFPIIDVNIVPPL